MGQYKITDFQGTHSKSPSKTKYQRIVLGIEIFKYTIFKFFLKDLKISGWKSENKPVSANLLHSIYALIFVVDLEAHDL